ncbi:MAG: hypothetical protein JNL26_07290, partial [Gemmatimonadetes bacterium]|nr:hypothetical protein [Gemmatimonadota bacterium]
AVRAGWIEAGPWYVLADNSIPGGEALVRNLAIGRKLLGELGASAPPVLYCPDTFGHPAAGPTLAAGFGLPVAIVWRGYGGRGWPDGDAARWRNEAGDEVLLHHLPTSGYEFGSSLPATDAEMAARWASMRDVLAPRSPSGQLLVLNGADHHAVQPDFDASRESLRRAATPAQLVEMGLTGFAESQLAFASRHELPAARGELRASPSYVWTLGGTMASRAYQKRSNARLERVLVHEVEPWLALAAWHGTVQGGAALDGVWRLLLASHPHDTLCGCSIDAVAQAMDDRHRGVDATARELRALALGAVTGDGGERPTGLEPPHVLVTNPVPRRRSGVVEATVDLPLARVPIGFGSAHAATAPRAVPRWSVRGEQPVPLQRLASERVVVRDEAPTRYPVTRLVERHRVLLWLDDMPAHGVSALSVVERASRARPPKEVRATATGLDNGDLQVWWDAVHGVCCRGAWGEWRDLLGFESEGERGDLYTHSAIPDTKVTGIIQGARVTARGPLRGELTLRVKVPIAPRSVAHPDGAVSRHGASSTTLRVRVQLDAGASWFRLIVDGASRAHDYRLRAVVRTGCRGDTHRADAAFGPVRRSNHAIPSQPGDVEQVDRTAPLHRYVTCADAHAGRGITVFSDGLAEYEATPEGTVAITLLRAVGELSRADLPERPGHAGYPARVPMAQCEGLVQATFAVLPHGADHAGTHALVEHVADDVLLPAEAAPARCGAVHRVEGLELAGDGGVRWLGTRPGATAGVLRVRLANVTSEARAATLTLPGVTAAVRLRLDDTPIGALHVVGERVRVEIPRGAVATIELRRDAVRHTSSR